MKTFVANSTADTAKLAAQVAALAQPGLVIALVGDLGAGKTTFTKAFAAALGVSDRVKSPTFNILNTYETGRLPLYHFDAYRLEETGAEEQGFEDYLGTDGVALVEWPQFMAALLPASQLTIDFSRGQADNERVLTVTGFGEAAAIEEQLR
ncbi:tRNA (adenosine(37)-N6)-threonylcarbamoyltransferase complex ATPase subunit type 1 TsaE [Leuconostocaceae bacterium ESL0958]|nr:tRNA (adenosine(37)-N6)-threonylcarbamoyltransferase complex ATPase subunit type 1 TsaE [Leuconostocaceae bacterium ESL0958]